MGRPRNYQCKSCSYTGHSPNDLHAHYTEFTTHKRPGGYVPVAERRAAKPSRANGKHVASPAHSEAFGQLDALRHKFETEVAREEHTIEQLKVSLAEHETELTRLRVAMEVLTRATDTEGDAPHRDMQHVPGRSLAG